jgi:ferredoxin
VTRTPANGHTLNGHSGGHPGGGPGRAAADADDTSQGSGHHDGTGAVARIVPDDPYRDYRRPSAAAGGGVGGVGGVPAEDTARHGYVFLQGDDGSGQGQPAQGFPEQNPQAGGYQIHRYGADSADSAQHSGAQQSGYQQAGYEQAGYEQAGYQQAGYQQAGYQQAGYQQAGYEQAGYQQAGYEQGGYQQGGYQQAGSEVAVRGNARAADPDTTQLFRAAPQQPNWATDAELDLDDGRPGIPPPPLRSRTQVQPVVRERAGWAAIGTPTLAGSARPHTAKGPRLRVDWPNCKAHGLCHELLPEAVRLDEWGYPIVGKHPLPDHVIDDARKAVLACPTLALRLVD